MAKQTKAEKRKAQFTGSTKNLEVPECGYYGLREKMTNEQIDFAQSILRNKLTFCNAGSGTGKTTVAVASMKYLYDLGIINKVVYVFSPCQEKALGYRPGNTEEKIADYILPLTDALMEIGEMPEKAMDEEHGWVKAVPDTFLRGSNLKNAGIIIDESQNYTKLTLKKTMTRIHDTCHAAVIGSTNQIDLPRPDDSGFEAMMYLFSQYQDEIEVGFCELTHDFRGKISQIADKLPIR